jgi:hypothetical protein
MDVVFNDEEYSQEEDAIISSEDQSGVLVSVGVY